MKEETGQETTGCDDLSYKLSKRFYVAPYNNFGVQILLVEKCTEQSLKNINDLFPEVDFIGSELAFVHKYYTGTKNLLVCFNLDLVSNPDENKKISVDCIAHECVHIKNIIYESIHQLPQTGENLDENEAYLVGYLTYIIFDFFQRNGHLEKIDFNYNEQHY